MSGVSPGPVVFEDSDAGGEAEGIMWSLTPLPHLAASLEGRSEQTAFREEGAAHRTQSSESISGSRCLRKFPQTLKEAHSGSRALRIAEDEAVAVYYQPRSCEELEVSEHILEQANMEAGS